MFARGGIYLEATMLKGTIERVRRRVVSERTGVLDHRHPQRSRGAKE